MAYRHEPYQRITDPSAELSQEAKQDWYVRYCCGQANTMRTDGSRNNNAYDVLAYDDSQYDGDHQFIQCMFPNQHESPHNRAAPLFNSHHAKTYKLLFQNYLGPWLFLVRFLASVGLFYDRDNHKVVLNRDGPHDRIQRVFQGHSNLRMIRVLKFLCLIDLQDVASAIVQTLMSLRDSGRMQCPDWFMKACMEAVYP